MITKQNNVTQASKPARLELPTRCRWKSATQQVWKPALLVRGHTVMKRVLKFVSIGLGLAFIAGCAVGPDYRRPTTTVPAQYKAEALGSWKEGQPLDHVPKGVWWEV